MSLMKHNRFSIAFLVAASLSALVGCGGDEGDDITINIDASTGSGGSNPDTPSAGDCNLVTQASFVSFNSDCSVGTLSGVITSDYELISEVEWRLAGEVVVGEGNVNVSSAADVQAVKDAGVTLIIQPGTNVKAFDDGSLIVTRGSMLMADGTAAEPITFSSLDSDFSGYGEWGGVIVQGFAPHYGTGGTGVCFDTGTTCNIEGEGGTIIGRFGGNEPDDNSGVIRYVRIAEGGLVAGPNNEINGLTLQGVGYGTTVEYVHVHNNLDDGIEWFGGTVNARYIVLTNNDDDDIDFDEGYRGNIQYAIVQKDPVKEAPTGTNDPRGIEANSSDTSYVPETNAVLANVTIVGGPANNVATGAQPGMRLRGALTTSIYNTAVKDFDTGCIRIDDANIGGGTVVDSNVSLTNILTDCEDGTYDQRAADSESGIVAEPFTLSATYAIQEASAQLTTAPTIIAMNNGSGFTFDNTDYIGAVDPSETSGWWERWTLPNTLGTAPADTSPSFVSCNSAVTQCTLSGVINQDYRLVGGVEWILDGEVVVGTGNVTIASAAELEAVRNAGVILSIDAGVHVRAEDDGSLLVTRGSRLEAVGTPVAPITFSSNADEDFDGLGEWGGVILQGFAPQYGTGNTGACFATGETWCNVEGEGGTIVGRFGGNLPDDNSGTLRYVRIAEGGLVAGPNNEINGLTLQGVGHSTTLEYIQVHGNLDDGVEWFGGTVNARYLVLTNNDDDSIDYDEGYQGNIQYAIVRMDQNKTAPDGSNDPRGIEANSSDTAYVPQTNATLANVLVIGGPLNDVVDGEQPGMRLRGALTTAIYNTAVTGFDAEGCIRVDNADIGTDIPSVVDLTNVIGDCTAGFYRNATSEANVDSETGTVGANAVTLDAAYALTDAEASVTAVTPTAVDNGSGFAFDETDYVGAVAPGTAASDAWWAGWIIPGSLD